MRARKIHRHDINIVANPVPTKEKSLPAGIRDSACADDPTTTKIAPMASMIMPAAASPSEICDRFFMRKASMLNRLPTGVLQLFGPHSDL
jgi:hypothetical protein